MDCEKRIRELLDRYFEGGTSLIEEDELRSYFSANETVAPDLEYARRMFDGFAATARHEVPSGKVSVPRIRRSVRMSLAVRISVVAASVAVVATASWRLIGHNQNKTVYAYINGMAITDQQEAMEQAEKMLQQVAGPLSQPVEELRRLSEINEKIGAALQNTNVN